MKKLSVFLVFFLPFFSFGQVIDHFSDGNFTENPVWSGTGTNFIVNSSFQLQSKALSTSTSFLFTPSEAFDDASWECWLKINYNPSSSNYASIYLSSDKNDISTACNGYFVQVGGTNDEVSLYVQEGVKKTKIIDGIDNRTDKSVVDIRIKITRDANGNFKLYSQLATEADYVFEGAVQNTVVKQSNYFGLLFSNTTTTGSDYSFDDVLVTGRKALDLEAPRWVSLSLEQPNRLQLVFSEAMDFSRATFTVDQGMGSPVSKTISSDQKLVTLILGSDFEKGKIYQLQLSGLTDLAGNELLNTVRSIGITEKIEVNDLVINEVMFENPANSLEYMEIYNRSDKLLDVSGIVFTTRKTDGSLNTGNFVPASTTLLPHGYLALCADADSVRNYHSCPLESNIITTQWSTLNNESASLVLCNSVYDTIYDELKYDVRWHHFLVKNPKGVALERIHPDLPTQDPSSWHSAASEVNFGTPGYKNSQYRDLFSEALNPKFAWIDPECFSPDNDGVDDVCFIRYQTESNGFVANVSLFNAVGVKIIQLASNELLSTEGFLIWDGKTDKGRNANVGIYVLYFEMFNPQTGARKQLKLPIVVSSR